MFIKIKIKQKKITSNSTNESNFICYRVCINIIVGCSAVMWVVVGKRAKENWVVRGDLKWNKKSVSNQTFRNNFPSLSSLLNLLFLLYIYSNHLELYCGFAFVNISLFLLLLLLPLLLVDCCFFNFANSFCASEREFYVYIFVCNEQEAPN